MTDHTNEAIDEGTDALAPISDDAISTEPFTARMIADRIDVDAKAFRSFWRAMIEKRGGTVGVDTPGSGKRYTFNVPTDDAMRAAYFDAMRAAYDRHRRTNNGQTVDASMVLDLLQD